MAIASQGEGSRGLKAVMRSAWRGSRQLILYGMIGCSGAGLDFVVFWLLTGRAGVHYQLANLVSVTFGITNNFFLNAFFNFRTTDRMLSRSLCFFGVGMFGWLMSATLLWAFVERCRMSDPVAKLATIFLVTAVQFVLNKTVTFRRRK